MEYEYEYLNSKLVVEFIIPTQTGYEMHRSVCEWYNKTSIKGTVSP